jgi:CheY-like chemotaxis protein
VEGDQAYAYQLKQILEERGAIVVLSQNLKEAKNCLNHSDFDLMISSHKLTDGNVRDLFEWVKDSLSTIPTLAAIGNCTQLEKKQLEKLGVKNFFSKSDSVKLFDDISKALFSFADFKKNYLESRYERGISYELSTGGKNITVKALEIMDKGIFLSFEGPLAFGHVAILKLTCTDDLHIESFSVSGVLQGEFSEGQFFKVNDDELNKWGNLLSQLDQKQDEVTQFLKKASGK